MIPFECNWKLKSFKLGNSTVAKAKLILLAARTLKSWLTL